MSLVTGADFGLRFPQGNTNDISPIVQALGGVINKKVQSDELAKRQQAETMKKAFQVTALSLLDISKKSDFTAKRQALVKMATDAKATGQDVSVFNNLLGIPTNDELDASILKYARMAGDAETQLNDRLKVTEQQAGTTIGKAKQDLDLGLITQAQYDQFTAGLLAGKPTNKPAAATDIGKINQDYTSGHISQDQRAQLLGDMVDKDAATLAEKTQLTPKDIAGVNDKVTALVKPTAEIVTAASALEGLEERGTPAAQLAAVFKFMKAMDPSSTVRESEQGQVYAAEGAMKGFAAQINQFIGEGGLTKTNFRDLTNTAKTLANTSIASTQNQLSGYLGVLEDNISAKQYNKMLTRVPGLFAVANPESKPDLNELTLEELLELKAQTEAGL